MEHKKVASSVLEAVGGKENINSVTHCVTRLRFKLKDREVPNKKEVENIDGVMSVIEQGGQYQVVIGNQVEPVYKQLAEMLNLESEKESEDITERENQKLFDRFTSMISGILTPVLGAMCAAGLLKGLIAILTVTNVLVDGDNNYIILDAIADTLFFFFPIIIGASAAKYFKMDHFIGILIGGVLVYPSIIAAASSGEAFTFLGLPMNLIDYSSSVFPVIIAIWIGSLLNKKLDKVIPQAVKYFLKPFIIIISVIPLTFFAIGPIITYVSDLLAQATFAIYDFSPVVAGIVIGGPWILIIMMGLHWAFIPVFINNFMTLGFDSVSGLLAANQFAMAAAAFAIGFRVTNKKERTLGVSTGATCLLGVSEPALYGVLLPRKKPLIMAIIGGSVGGAFGGLLQARMYSFTAQGIFAIPGGINPQGIDLGFYGYVGQMVVGFIVAFILTYFWGYKTKTKAVPINK